MSTAEHRQLTAAVGIVIDDMGDRDVAVVDVVRIVKRDHADTCAAVADAAIDRMITTIAKRHLKPAGDDAPQLPGFELPLRIPIVTEGGFIWRHTTQATRADLRSYDKLLEDGWKKDRDRHHAYRREMHRVIKLLDANGVDRLADLP